MATLEYRFTRSTPVLRDLARTRSVATSPLLTSSSERTEKANPFEFIDGSLGLLADLQKTQDNDLRREFKQQRDFINEKFEREQYENGRRDQAVDERFTKIKEKLENFKQEVGQRFEEVGQRFEEVGQRFEEVGQRFEEVGQRFEEVGQRFDRVEQRFEQRFEEVGQRFEEVGQRFDEMRAMMFNSLSYRAHDNIHPVSVFIGNRLRKPDENYFPRNIREFWSLHSRSPKKG
jgi:DNA anti-recombination protein RmuC